MAEQGISRLLLEAFRALDSEIDDALEDRGAADLTPSQAAALIQIDRTGTRLTELAARTQISKQAMMQVVDGLEASGSVRRVPDPNDARAKIVKLTARGLRERAGARKAVAAVETRIRRRLGDRRYEAFKAILEDLAASEG